MFGYLKEKLKGAVDKFSNDVDEESFEATESELSEKEQKKGEEKEKTKETEEERADGTSSKEDEKQEKGDVAEEEEKGGWFSGWWKKKDKKPDEADEAIGEKEEEITTAGEEEPESAKEESGKEEELSEKKEEEESLVSNAEKETIDSKEEPAKKESSKEVKKQTKKKEKKEEVDSSVKAEEIIEEKSETREVAEEVSDKEQEALEEEKVAGDEAQLEGEPEEEEKKGFFGRFRDSVYDAVTKKAISEKKFEELFWEIEMVLLENNVAVEVIEKIKEDLKKELVDKKVRRGKTSEIITDTLKESINELFVERLDLLEKIKAKEDPYVVTFVGVNGSGKTTSIAKLAYKLKQEGYNPVIAAADTFRAAAIQQLEEHANNVGVKLIKHDYGADPAAVCFDAIKYAKSKKMDVVLIDTAGRLHSNTNLVDEMKKIVRVAQPDLKIFVGESTTGNDCIEQAKEFNEAIAIDGIILAKTDVDSKGGAAISVSYVTGKPIIYIGTGQDYKDLTEFDPKLVVENLGLST